MSADTDARDLTWVSSHTDFMKRLALLLEKDDGKRKITLSQVDAEHNIRYRFVRSPDSVKLAVEMDRGVSKLTIRLAPEDSSGTLFDRLDLDEKYRQLTRALAD